MICPILCLGFVPKALLFDTLSVSLKVVPQTDVGLGTFSIREKNRKTVGEEVEVQDVREGESKQGKEGNGFGQYVSHVHMKTSK